MKAYFLLLMIVTTFYITNTMSEKFRTPVRYVATMIESAVMLKAHLG